MNTKGIRSFASIARSVRSSRRFTNRRNGQSLSKRQADALALNLNRLSVTLALLRSLTDRTQYPLSKSLLPLSRPHLLQMQRERTLKTSDVLAVIVPDPYLSSDLRKAEEVVL